MFFVCNRQSERFEVSTSLGCIVYIGKIQILDTTNTLSDVIMFNYVMFLVNQQFEEEENWNRLHTIPDKEVNYKNGFVRLKDVTIHY
jgi:hypothetical protein